MDEDGRKQFKAVLQQNEAVYSQGVLADYSCLFCQRIVRWVSSGGRKGWWNVWNGKHWETNADLRVQEMIEFFIHDYLLILGAKQKKKDEMQKMSYLSGVIELLKGRKEIYTRADHWNTREDCVVFKDGTTLFIEDGVIGPPMASEPENLITAPVEVAPIAYDGFHEDDASEFITFMRYAFDDPETLEWVQRYLGSILLPRNKNRLLVCFIGQTTNGKSTLLNILSEVIGFDLVSVIPTELICSNRGGRHPTDLTVSIRDKLLVVVPEADADTKLDSEKLKELTGERTTRGRLMYQDGIVVQLLFKMIMMTNGIPRFSRFDAAMGKRLRAVPMRKVIKQSMLDPNFDARLQPELAGIMAWLLEGLERFMAMKGLMDPVPNEIARETDRMAKNLNPVEFWIQARVVRLIPTEAGEKVSYDTRRAAFEEQYRVKHPLPLKRSQCYADFKSWLANNTYGNEDVGNDSYSEEKFFAKLIELLQRFEEPIRQTTVRIGIKNEVFLYGFTTVQLEEQ